MANRRFLEYCRRKEAAAAGALMPGFLTVSDWTSPYRLQPVGNGWSRTLFDGDFYRTGRAPADRPLVNLVFVQSRDGNTGADDPSSLGGGETDKHLVYEGLSRVEADAVLAGATTASAEDIVFSVWHPELVALRLARGLPRHPAQVLVTDVGNLPIQSGLMFQEPDLPVFLVSSTRAACVLKTRLATRPWVTVIDAGEALSLTRGLRHLRERGIAVLSSVGGRKTATALLREGLVDDLYLTTSPTEGGQPDTPFYSGPPLDTTKVIEKAGRGPEQGVRFEHFLIRR